MVKNSCLICGSLTFCNKAGITQLLSFPDMQRKIDMSCFPCSVLSVYRVDHHHHVMDLGWLDIQLGCSPILPGQQVL